MLEEILELHKSGQFEQAEDRYREWLLFNPDDPEVLHLLGMLRRQRGDFHEGVELVSRAIALVPDRANYHMTLGGMQFHLRQWHAAQTSFQVALNLNPNLTSAYSALGQIAMIQGDPSNAEQNFKTALRATEDDPQVLTSLGNLQMTRGNNELALKYLSRAAELNPDDPATQASLGRALFSQGMTAFAEQALNNALRLKPDFSIAKLVLGEVQFQRGHLAEARKNFNQLIAAGQHLAPAHAGMGDVARAQGDLANACQHYENSLASKREQPRVAVAWAWCLRSLGEIDKAIKVLNNTFEFVAGDTALCRALTALLSEKGHHDKAARIWAEYATECPGDSLAFVHQACELELAGNYENAAKVAEQIASRQSVNPELTLLRARAALRDSHPETILRALERLDNDTLSVSQKRLKNHYLGLIHDRLQRFSQAVTSWLGAHRIESESAQLPSLPSVHAELGEAIIAAAALASESGPRVPTFLIGAPGSGVERLAGLLSDQPDLLVLRDRFQPNGRRDGFTEPDFEQYVYGINADSAHRFARRYQRALERLAPPANRRIIDWLPQWDARFLPLITAAFPGARLIVAQRNPRDTFLNWLAYGWTAGFAITDLETTAQWLAQAFAHESACAKATILPQLYVNTDTMLDASTPMGTNMAQFLELSELLPGLNYQRTNQGLGGLPMMLPVGYWKRYQQALSTAFSSFNGL